MTIANLGAANIDAQTVTLPERNGGDAWFDMLVYPSVDGCSLESLRDYLDNEGAEGVPAEYGRFYDDLSAVEGLDPVSAEDTEYALTEWHDAIRAAAADHWLGDGYSNIAPVMFWAWPVSTRQNPGELQMKLILAHLPVCVVNVNGELALALTGGGMDLTWELCEAYMIAGQLPPAALAGRLPHMSGRGESADDRAIIAACHESLRIAAMRAEHDRDDLRMSYGLTTAELAAFGLEG
jgi:hypothetical protein